MLHTELFRTAKVPPGVLFAVPVAASAGWTRPALLRAAMLWRDGDGGSPCSDSKPAIATRMGKNVPPPPHPPQPTGGEPVPVNLRDALEERYLAYALSTIMGRALPDARDGLKPVHRRILYGMQMLRPRSRRRLQEMRENRRRRDGLVPSARRPGDLRRAGASRPGLRLALSAGRRPGQFRQYRRRRRRRLSLHRSADDRRRAASSSKASTRTRSTSATIIPATTKEPIVLPGAFPNLLANGAQGIAVGMATSIPPHNVAELCDAALYLIAHRNATTRSSC